MSAPTNQPPPPIPSEPLPTPSIPSAPNTSTAPPNPHPPAPPPSPKPPLKGFRSALEHTGVPHSVLNWKPRLPSRNWYIFLTVVGTIGYLYYDDRKQCDRIKKDYIGRVEHLAREPLKGSLDLPRKVLVIGARWPEDDDEDRALRYFRKYVKPYLVAAAIDYEQLPAPLLGSVTRQIHAQILKKRRQSLKLEEPPLPSSLPFALDPAAVQRRELEGGIVLVGRPSLKEYLEGLNRGWMGDVESWEWEKEVGDKIFGDGVFESKPDPIPELMDDMPNVSESPSSAPTPQSSSPSTSASITPPSFLARPPQPIQQHQSNPQTPQQIPLHYHTPPSPLPAQPPILLVPFVSHLGFRQVPNMIYDFFTERYRVQSGASAALRLIESQTRELTTADLDFDQSTEKYYKKSLYELPKRVDQARKDYYDALQPRLEAARLFAKGERELTKAEQKSDKPVVTEDDLRAERKKREMRWFGNLDGLEIVRPEKEIVWREEWDGWLRVYDEDKFI